MLWQQAEQASNAATHLQPTCLLASCMAEAIGLKLSCAWNLHNGMCPTSAGAGMAVLHTSEQDGNAPVLQPGSYHTVQDVMHGCSEQP